NGIMQAFSLPKTTEEEKKARHTAIQEATKFAIDIPFRVMELACNSMEIIKAMALIGNPNSVSDAGVGAVCALAAVKGAFLNVRINAMDYDDKNFVNLMLEKGKTIEEKATLLETEILNIVHAKLGNE
ncbi:MAG TPA: cyclodeaminase/cyclohydrolase family protein, partial [Chitinophagaceae bacterium]|nr:cyclodeaminase/cyclohydrolase family protein [Chitinophagaceae bacterium]